MNEDLRFRLEQAHRILHMEGLAEDASRGHITARGEDGRILIKPWGVGFEDVKANHFQALDLDGNLIEGEGRVHSEVVLHLEIYRRRPEVFSVAHVHPFYSILLSSVFKGRINVVSQHGTLFIGKLPFYPVPDLIQSRDDAAKLARTLGDKPAVLMKNHGITVVGKSIEEATIVAIHFEKAAKEHLMASSFGKPSSIPPASAKRLTSNNYSPAQIKMLWDYHWKKFEKISGAGR